MNTIDYLKLYIKVGVDVTVKHQNGEGGVKTTNGTLQNPDDKGYVIIELPNGKFKYIPKDKVIEIIED